MTSVKTLLKTPSTEEKVNEMVYATTVVLNLCAACFGQLRRDVCNRRMVT
jgi:hypothetical protein